MTLNFGKHKGEALEDVPREYLEWLIATKRTELKVYTAELERRDHLEEATLPMMERVVLAGYRSMAKYTHPDVGGDTKTMQELNASFDTLKQLVKQRMR